MGERSQNKRQKSPMADLSVLSPTDCLEFVRQSRPNRGSLVTWNLAALLHSLRVERASGVLQVAKPPVEKLIYFLRGYPVRVDSDLRSETLGAHLRRIGRLSEDTHQQLIEEMHETGQRQGELLIKSGVVSPRELYDVLSSHMAEKITSCFAWDDGVYSFERGNHLPGQMVTFDLLPGRIILDGVQQYFSEELLDSLLALPDGSRPYLRQDPPYHVDQLNLTEHEASMYRLSAEGLTVGEVYASAGVDSLMGRRIYFALYMMEIVGFELGGQSRPSIAPEPLSDARHRDFTGIAELDIDASEKLVADYLRLMDADYFTFFGLDKDTDEAQVHAAFQRMVPTLQREALVNLTPVARDKGTELMERLFEAYHVLVDPGRRKWYIGHLEGKVEEEPEEVRSFSLQTEVFFNAACESICSGQPGAAVEALQSALDLKLGEPQYEAWLGWALYVSDPVENRDLAKRHIETARSTLPELQEPFLFLARMSEFEGRDDDALELYGEAASRAAWDEKLSREAELFDKRLAEGNPRRRSVHATGDEEDLGNLVWRLFHEPTE